MLQLFSTNRTKSKGEIEMLQIRRNNPDADILNSTVTSIKKNHKKKRLLKKRSIVVSAELILLLFLMPLKKIKYGWFKIQVNSFEEQLLMDTSLNSY